jgi:hypothetical protein
LVAGDEDDDAAARGRNNVREVIARIADGNY